MEVLNYYKLKEKYESLINERKKTIKTNENLTAKEKRAKFKKIIPNCINCKKAGGTTFEEKNGMLKAVCAATPQCALNINIKRKYYENARDLEIKNNKTNENLKMRIIMTKLDYLFGLNKSKEDIVDKFNTLKTELSALAEKQLILTKNYGDIISGINRDPLLNDAALDLANAIDELKNIYDEYQVDQKPSYLITMVEKYLTIILPLTEQIKKIKYGYYEVEKDDEDKEEIYTLVANPYRFEQMEQERK